MVTTSDTTVRQPVCVQHAAAAGMPATPERVVEARAIVEPVVGKQRKASPEPVVADAVERAGAVAEALAVGERVVDGRERAARRAQFEAEALVHLDALYSFALKLSRARDDAEDLVSDTMLRAIERWEQYRLGTNIRAWLFTILYHVFVSRKRRIDAREVQQPEDTEGWALFEAVGEADPEGRFYDSFLDDEITRAIRALPEEYRAAVVLSDLQGLRYAEIADALGVPEGTVKSRLFRGRRILQKKLVGYAVEMGYIKPSVASA
jgi:RNA polymerase sigma-70 factor (ECF subfamily)